MKSILEYLERTVKKYPSKIAFADEKEQCSFHELWTLSKTAGSFLSKRNCQRRPVPVLMKKGIKTISVLLGIVYAGGFYIVLDESQPIHRLNKILETLNAELLIAEEGNRDLVQQTGFSGKIITPEELFCEEIDESRLKSVAQKQCDLDPLYVMFTSGSTGVPKGVVVSHRSVIDFIDPFSEIFGFTEEDVIGNQAPWDFDISVKDIYTGLKTGATVQLIPKKYFSFPRMLLDFLEERKVTSLTWAVSALCIVSSMNGFSYKVPSSIKRILFSGEMMPVRHLNDWRQHLPEAMFVNLYGPTEITCNCTYYILDREFEAGDRLPIGQAFPNEHVFLLDEADQEVLEAGKEGEICVSGTALALGYYHNPEQTAKVFVQNPLNPFYEERIYRTGDMGMYNEQGELLFSTRKDFQIKHMGHRIELGEIEAVLEKIQEIKRSCCFFDKETNKMVCFYQGAVDKKYLRKEMAAYLPNYMIPNVLCPVEEMPVTKNGKIDRKYLIEHYFRTKKGSA